MEYYITKYALSGGIKIVEIDNYDNGKDYYIHGYSYLKKNKDIFDNKDNAEINFIERRNKKIESLKKQLVKIEKMKIKYEKE